MGAHDPVLTRRRLDEVVEEFFYGPSAFVIDVETAGQYRLDPRRNELVWMQIATSGGLCEVIPVGHPNGERNGTTKEPRKDKNGKTRYFTVPTFSPPPRQLSPGEALEAMRPLFFSKKRKVGVNVKFDLETIAKHYGELPEGPYVDLQMVEFLLNENYHEYKLEKLMERRFDIRMDKSIGAEIEKHPFSAAALYCHLDARREWQLYKDTVWRLKGDDLHGLYWDLEVPVLEACARMETRGVLMDREAAEEVDTDLERRIAESKRKLYQIAGREWNLDSNPQKQAVFYASPKKGGQGLKPTKRTGTGAPSCDKDALEAHEGNPLVDEYLRYQEITKIRQYTGAYLGSVEKKSKNKNRNDAPAIGEDGRVHANFKPHGARTGRFSCSEPNLQNIPRPDTDLGKEIRRLFVAEPGRVLLVADYAQIEYVVLAHFSQDPELIRYFSEGLDFHQAVASRLLRKPLDEVTKVERTTSKNTNFATVYGAGVDKIATMSKIPLEQAKSFQALHRRMLPRVYQFTDDVVRVCRSRRPPHVKTLLGRKRRLPTIHAKNDSLRLEAERQAVNSVIQGSAADINKLAMVRIDRTSPSWMWLLLNVHDEFVVSVPERHVDEGAEILEEAMVGAGISDLMDVPLRTDVKAVDRWSEAKD